MSYKTVIPPLSPSGQMPDLALPPLTRRVLIRTASRAANRYRLQIQYSSLLRQTCFCPWTLWSTSQISDLTDTLAMQRTCTGTFSNPRGQPGSFTAGGKSCSAYLCCKTSHSNTVSVNLWLCLLTLVAIVVAHAK